MNREQARAAAEKRWRNHPVVECRRCGAVHRCDVRGEKDGMAGNDAGREGENEGGVKEGGE